MRFSIKRVFLEQLLDKANTVSVLGTVKEELKGFLLELDGKTLRVMRTDENLAVLAQTELLTIQDPSAPHQIVVSGEKFYNLVKRLDCDEIEIATDDTGQECMIAAGAYNGSWASAGKPTSFPKLSAAVKPTQEQEAISIDAKKFVELLERVQYAAAHESIRVSLKQLVFEDGICWASDDTIYQRVRSDLPKELRFAVPIAALDIIKFIRLSSADSIELICAGDYYFFKVGEDKFVCRAPNLRAIKATGLVALLSGESKQGRFTAETQRLLSIVKRMSITTDVRTNRLDFEIQPGVLRVSSQDNDGNSAEEKLRINFSGSSSTKKKFGLHWEVVIHALESVRQKTVDVRIDDNHVVFASDDGLGIVPMLIG